MQKVLYIPQEKWEPDIHHHRKADDLGARLEITKGAALCHGDEPRVRPPIAQGWFNLTLSDPQELDNPVGDRQHTGARETKEFLSST